MPMTKPDTESNGTADGEEQTPTVRPFRPNFDLLRRVRMADDATVAGLVRLTGLESARDFRHADLRGLDWRDTDPSQYDTTGSLIDTRDVAAQSPDQIAKTLRDVLQLETLEIVDILRRLAEGHHAKGELLEAYGLYQTIMALQSHHFGATHPEVAATLSVLGALDREQGRFDNARTHLERALAIQETALGPAHPSVAVTLQVLGLVDLDLGRFDDARTHLERALAINEAALGPAHSSVAATLYVLGFLDHDQGRLDDARSKLERALAINEAALGPAHPDVAATLHNLGAVDHQQGRPDDARSKLERALVIREAALGPTHPSDAATLHALGRVDYDQGRLDDARSKLERALAIQETALGPAHPYTQAIEDALADLLRAMQNETAPPAGS